jgi:hypothetical protein
MWTPPTSIIPWLIASMAISILAFCAGLFTIGNHKRPPFLRNYIALYRVFFLFTISWLLTLVIAVMIHHWRGLWLLIGAPFALFWPAVIVCFAFAIGRSRRSLRQLAKGTAKP